MPPEARTEERPVRRRPELPTVDPAVRRYAFGSVVAILAWLGWVALAPAFGAPELAPGAMLNRALRVDVGSRWGWVAFVVLLALLAAAFAIAASGRVVVPDVRSGVLLAVAAWLVAGVVLLPLLGLVTPDAPPTIPSDGAAGPTLPDDPEVIRPTIMMFHLGVLAPISALVAWILFGAVLGATGSIVGAAERGPTPEELIDVSEPATERREASTRALGALGVVTGLLVVVSGLWAASRPAEAAVACGDPFGRRLTGRVEGDVQVTSHGTVCAIRGTVTGDVLVRDTSPSCADREAVTAIHVIGGEIGGNVVAEGRRCVMVWLRDGARVGGDIVFDAKGRLEFLGDDEGATVDGDVVLERGRLSAGGDAATNRIGGDLRCLEGGPAGGAGTGSPADWDGLGDGPDGTIEGIVSGC